MVKHSPGNQEIGGFEPHHSHLVGKTKMDSGKAPAHKCPTSPHEIGGRPAKSKLNYPWIKI